MLFFIEYKFLPRNRVWQKMRGDVVLSVLSQPIQRTGITKVPKEKPLTELERRKKLEEVSKVVDTGVKIKNKTSQKATP